MAPLLSAVWLTFMHPCNVRRSCPLGVTIMKEKMETRSMKRKTAQYLHIFYQVCCEDVKNNIGTRSLTDLSPRGGHNAKCPGALNSFSSLQACRKMLLLSPSEHGDTGCSRINPWAWPGLLKCSSKGKMTTSWSIKMKSKR